MKSVLGALRLRELWRAPLCGHSIAVVRASHIEIRHQIRSQSNFVNTTPSPGPNVGGAEESSTDGKRSGSPSPEEEGKWKSTGWKVFESAVTTFASVAILGLVGYTYTRYYKNLVIKKMEHAFAPGDPVLALATKTRSSTSEDGENRIHWIDRAEQDLLDAIVNGSDKGHYFLVLGEKGTGKSSMLLEAMRKIDGEGVSMLDAHADMEVFRLRLGKALDFEFHEDNIGSLFSIRGPRDASALLDIERALNKLEKVALRHRKRTGKPLVLIINSLHLLRDDDDGRDLMELLQQRAEQWAAGNLCTMIFNSDDYWVYERLKVLGTRMEIIPVPDLTRKMALAALHSYRITYFDHDASTQELEEVYRRVGGRLSFLHRVAKEKDMLKVCDEICAKEKQWFLNQCWILGAEMDDDVMDQQKYTASAMLLARALVQREREMEVTYDSQTGYLLPQIPLHEAKQIMTRADFIRSYDHNNIFTIDSRAMVRADSVPMQKAFREICSQPGFDEYLEATLDRIGDIESLGRTRELTIKDLWKGGKYRILEETDKQKGSKGYTFEVLASPDEGGDGKEEQDGSSENE